MPEMLLELLVNISVFCFLKIKLLKKELLLVVLLVKDFLLLLNDMDLKDLFLMNNKILLKISKIKI